MIDHSIEPTSDLDKIEAVVSKQRSEELEKSILKFQLDRSNRSIDPRMKFKTIDGPCASSVYDLFKGCLKGEFEAVEMAILEQIRLFFMKFRKEKIKLSGAIEDGFIEMAEKVVSEHLEQIRIRQMKKAAKKARLGKPASAEKSCVEFVWFKEKGIHEGKLVYNCCCDIGGDNGDYYKLRVNEKVEPFNSFDIEFDFVEVAVSVTEGFTKEKFPHLWAEKATSFGNYFRDIQNYDYAVYFYVISRRYDPWGPDIQMSATQYFAIGRMYLNVYHSEFNKLIKQRKHRNNTDVQAWNQYQSEFGPSDPRKPNGYMIYLLGMAEDAMKAAGRHHAVSCLLSQYLNIIRTRMIFWNLDYGKLKIFLNDSNKLDILSQLKSSDFFIETSNIMKSVVRCTDYGGEHSGPDDNHLYYLLNNTFSFFRKDQMDHAGKVVVSHNYKLGNIQIRVKLLENGEYDEHTIAFTDEYKPESLRLADEIAKVNTIDERTGAYTIMPPFYKQQGTFRDWNLSRYTTYNQIEGELDRGHFKFRKPKLKNQNKK